MWLRHQEQRLSASIHFASKRIANNRTRRNKPRFASLRPVAITITERNTSKSLPRCLHLCVSCFSCAPPCCKFRVTLARTNPLLTLPAVEAAANWPRRYMRVRLFKDLLKGSFTHAEVVLPMLLTCICYSLCCARCQSLLKYSTLIKSLL